MRAGYSVAEVGLELSAEGLTLVRFQKGIVVEIVTAELEAIADETHARKRLLETLSTMVAEHRVTGCDCAIALTGEILLNPVILPEMPEPEYRRAVELELHDELGLNLAELECDLIQFRTFKDSEGAAQVESLVATITRLRAHAIAQLVHEAGLTPTVLMPPIQAIISLIHQAQELPAPTFLWMEIGLAHTTIAIFHERQLLTIDELTFGYHPLISQLTREIQDKTGSIQLTEPEARQLLGEHGIPIEVTEERWLGKITPLLTIVALRAQLDRLINEVKHSLSYVATKFPEWPVKTITLSGWGAGVSNLDRYLADQLGVEVRSAHTLLVLKTSQTLKALPSAIDAGLVASGAALTVPGQGLNLLPLEFRTKRLERIQWFSLKAAAVLAVLLLATGYIFLMGQIRHLRQELQAKQSKLTSLAPTQEMHKRVQARQALYRRITSTELPLPEVMQEISMSIPSQIWLSTATMDRQLGFFVLRGVVFAGPIEPAERILSQFLASLEASPFFGKISLTSLQRDPRNPYLSTFEATAQIVSEASTALAGLAQ